MLQTVKVALLDWECASGKTLAVLQIELTMALQMQARQKKRSEARPLKTAGRTSTSAHAASAAGAQQCSSEAQTLPGILLTASSRVLSAASMQPAVQSTCHWCLWCHL